jgi:hypothetical protein
VDDVPPSTPEERENGTMAKTICNRHHKILLVGRYNTLRNDVDEPLTNNEDLSPPLDNNIGPLTVEQDEKDLNEATKVVVVLPEEKPTESITMAEKGKAHTRKVKVRVGQHSLS